MVLLLHKQTFWVYKTLKVCIIELKIYLIFLHKKISRRATRRKLKKAHWEYLVVGRNQVKLKKSPNENIFLWFTIPDINDCCEGFSIVLLLSLYIGSNVFALICKWNWIYSNGYKLNGLAPSLVARCFSMQNFKTSKILVFIVLLLLLFYYY